MVPAEHARQDLDLIIAGLTGPAPAAFSAAAGPPRQHRGVFPILQGGQVQRGNLRLDLAVDDQLFLLDQLIKVLLEILPQQLIMLVLSDMTTVNSHAWFLIHYVSLVYLVYLVFLVSKLSVRRPRSGR